jgi:hypothetical protein
MGTGIGFGNGINVVEQQRILGEFMAAADARQERLVYDANGALADPNALQSLERIAAMVAERGNAAGAQVIRDKRRRLMQLQGGL